MTNRKRLCKILVYLLVLAVSIVTLYWFGGGKSLTAEMAFHRQEKLNMIGPSNILATIDFPHGRYDHMMIGISEYGYTFYEWYDTGGWDKGEMTYIPKQEGATLFCTYYRYGSAAYSQDWLPIFAFADAPLAVSAKLTLNTTNKEGETVNYPLEAQRSENGYFLFAWNAMNLCAEDFWLVQQLITGQNREYKLSGTAEATLELYNRNGELLETYHFTK